MGKGDRGLSRRQFVQASSGLLLAGLLPGTVLAQSKEGAGPAKKSGTRVILLGTDGGPRPKKMRNQSASVVLVNDVPYVVDCGGGVSRQLAFANIPSKDLRHIFITHHHSDHNLEYGSLMYNAWASGFKGKIDTYGPPPIQKITDLFLETNASER